MMLLTPDEKLIHAILQVGVQGFFDARRAGVKADILFDEARPIWELMEALAKLNRLPSLTEIHLKTGIQIDEICPDPIDVELAVEKIVKRGLTTQLLERLNPLYKGDAFAKDPYEIRDELIDIYQATAWGLGKPLSLNSRDAIEKFKKAYNKAAKSGDGLQGLSSPWPTADSASLGLQPGELTVLFAKRKIGKTLSGSVLVHDPVTGQERTIKELVEAGDGRVLTWEKNKPLRHATPAHFLDCGMKECVKITWRSGRSMIAAKTHPFLTPRGWKRADELQEGHHTGATVFVPAPTKPDERWLDCEIKFLAYMIAEGGCTKSSTPTFTSGVPELVEEMRACLEPMRCQLSPVRDRPKTFNVVKIDSTGSSMAVNQLRHTGLLEKKSIEKVIPPRIFSLNDHQLGIFLGRLWSCDGSVEKSGMISYSTGSHRLALQVQHLLLRFGVTSRVRTIKRTIKSTGEERDYYEIYVHRRCVERFKAHVKLIGPKAKRIQEVFFQGKDRVGFLKNEELQDLIRAEMDSRPDLLEDVGDELGYSCKFMKSHPFDSQSGRIRRKVFETFCEIYDSPLKWILDENVWWDEIVSIEDAGEHHCYDLSIPETECYIANDFIVHNSWMVIVWAVHMWKNDLKPGQKILFVTMEMTELQIMRRMACVDLRLPWDDLRKGKLTMHQKKLMDDWCDQRIAEEGDPTKPNIIFATAKECRTAKDIGALVAEHQPVCVVVDSFYILGRQDNKSIYERVLGNVQALKLDVALTHDVPVLASTQLKGTVDKETLSADSDDAMGAKAIGDYADVTRGLFADEEMWAAGKRLWRGMEAREFKPKDVEINFNFETMDFSEIREITEDDLKQAKEERKQGRNKRKKPTDEELEKLADVTIEVDDDGEMSI